MSACVPANYLSAALAYQPALNVARNTNTRHGMTAIIAYLTMLYAKVTWGICDDVRTLGVTAWSYSNLDFKYNGKSTDRVKM